MPNGSSKVQPHYIHVLLHTRTPAMAAAAHDATNAKVMIRLRPPAEKFKASSMFTIDANEPGIIGLKGSGTSDPEREFVFDSVFDETVGNSAVFEQCCRSNLEAVVMRGLSASVICYGPTGSGKLHTAIGDLSDESRLGVLPRVLKQLFNLIAARPDLKFSVSMSAVELCPSPPLPHLHTTLTHVPPPHHASLWFDAFAVVQVL